MADYQEDLFCECGWYGRMWTVPLNSVPVHKQVNYVLHAPPVYHVILWARSLRGVRTGLCACQSGGFIQISVHQMFSCGLTGS